jgi:hypothetical protein
VAAWGFDLSETPVRAWARRGEVDAGHRDALTAVSARGTVPARPENHRLRKDVDIPKLAKTFVENPRLCRNLPNF